MEIFKIQKDDNTAVLLTKILPQDRFASNSPFGGLLAFRWEVFGVRTIGHSQWECLDNIIILCVLALWIPLALKLSFTFFPSQNQHKRTDTYIHIKSSTYMHTHTHTHKPRARIHKHAHVRKYTSV